MDKSDFLILHISDLHFGANTCISFSRPELQIDSFIDVIKNTLEKDFKIKKIVVAIGGDISNKGNPDKYAQALVFFRLLKEALVDYSLSFILCPGNHDLKSSGNKDFSLFNQFSTTLTGTLDFIFNEKNTVRLFELYNYSFILLNSQFHLDYEFGLIDIAQFEAIVAEAKYPLIILLHHNLIPIYPKNLSTVRNSFPFLSDCLSLDNVRMILHGHVHSSFRIEIGMKNKTFPIIGVGALLPELNGNYNNQFNIYELNEIKVKSANSYRIIADSVVTSKFNTLKEELL